MNLLIKQFFIQNNVVHVKTEQWLLSQIVTLKVEACVTLCCHWMPAISIEFWALWTELCYSFLHSCNVLESVVTKIHPQWADKMKVTWSQGRAVWLTFESLPSKLLQQCFLLSGYVGSKHKVTLIFLSCWRIIVVVTDAQLVQKFKKLFHNGSFSNSQNSMLKAYIHW